MLAVSTQQNEVSQRKVRSNVYLDKELKSSAEKIFKNYGLNFSNGLNLLLRQTINKQSPILISDLDIEPVYPDDPDYKIMQEARKEKGYPLDEVMKEYGIA